MRRRRSGSNIGARLRCGRCLRVISCRWLGYKVSARHDEEAKIWKHGRW